MSGRYGKIFFTFVLAILLAAGGCVAPRTAATSPPTTTPRLTSAPTPTVIATSEPAAQSPDVFPSIASVVDKVLPSVVFILAQGQGQSQSAGSGVILRPDGYILTNKHVVAGAAQVTLTLHNRESYVVPANKIWQDDIVDLAVVKIEASNLPTVPFADPDLLKVGDWVVALGHALGFSPAQGGATVTFGIISNLERSFSIESTEYYDVIQTDAAINPGNSGGPLVNLAGELVGINAAGAQNAQDIGFAINVGTARHVYEDLIQYGKSHHPYIGLSLKDVDCTNAGELTCPQVSGAAAVCADPSGPAGAAGIKPNDVITNFSGKPVESATDLIRNLLRNEVGDKVEITYYRAGREQRATVTLAERGSRTACSW